MEKTDNSGIEAFTFGDDVPVLDKRELWGFMNVTHNGRYYNPRIDPRLLIKFTRASPHHDSAIQYIINQIIEAFIPNKYLDDLEFEKFLKDYFILANSYFQKVESMTGKPLKLMASPGAVTRVGIEEDQYWYIDDKGRDNKYQKGEIFQFLNPDPDQEIYGAPSYLGAVQAILLNEAATIFRRRYFKNGSFAGHIFYLSDAQATAEDVEVIRTALKETKGRGNFKNMFLYAPNGKKDGLSLIPLAEASAKDEFTNIKTISRDDILAAWRVPPVLLGIVPANNGGFGDVTKARDVFWVSEIAPIIRRLKRINTWFGVEALVFKDFEPMASKGIAPNADKPTNN